jgi:endonuclease YncB( thermonuclease family)
LLAAVYLFLRTATTLYAYWNRDTTVSRLRETEYTITQVMSPHEWIIEREDAGNVERAKVRLLAVRIPRPEELDGTQRDWDVVRATDQVRHRWHGKRVRIELGRRQLARDGTLLISAYAGETNVQEQLVRAGWLLEESASEDLPGLVRQLKSAQQHAQQAGVGFWRHQLVEQPSL